MRRVLYLVLMMVWVCVAPSLYGQDPRAELQKRLSSQFTLTKATADGSDIVKAGSVLVLHKDGLMLCSLEAKAQPTSTYKNGAISFGLKAQMGWGMALGAAGQQANNIPQRKFVDGEKFWITGYSIQNDGVVLSFYSDPYNDVRYFGQLKFPFPKGAVPPADEIIQTIAEVVTVDAPQDAQPADASAQGAGPAASSDAAPAEPKTIKLGQTKDEVVSILGQPVKIVSLGAKEIYYYTDMKIIFVGGKVSDVQ